MSSSKCAVAGCEEEASKLLNRRYLEVLVGLGLKVNPPRAGKIPLCTRHYKMARDAMRAIKRKF